MAGPVRWDAVVVLGARVMPGGRASAALRRRTAHGAALILAGRADHLVLTGGRAERGVAEAQVMRDLAIERGVPPERIVLEPAARSTLENAAFTARIAHARGFRSLLVVTDRYHLPRALMAFRRLGLTVAGSPVPPDTDDRRTAEWAVELIKWPPFLWRIAVRERGTLRAARRR